jgi:hypothetical protein
MIGGTARRDSWDAIAKTKSLLSYGSLESLANLANNSSIVDKSTMTNANNINNSYRNELPNVNNIKNSSANYSSLKKFSSSEYTFSPKLDSVDSFSNSRGILKNKAGSSLRPDVVDSISSGATSMMTAMTTATTTTTMTTTMTTTTIQEKQQYHKDESSHLRKMSNQETMATGSALQMLAVHRPTCFTLDSSLDTSRIAVIVTGNFIFYLLLIKFITDIQFYCH